MKQLVGITLGAVSGFLMYMMAAMLAGPDNTGALFVGFTFLGGWALSSVVLIRGAMSVSKVFSRAFLLGAAEWLAMIPVGLVLSGKAFSDSVDAGAQAGDAEAAGAALGAGCFSVLTGAFSVVMVVVCLIGFAVSYFIGREMKPEAAPPTRKCPECAELIQPEARKCRHCGAVLAAPPESPSANVGGVA